MEKLPRRRTRRWASPPRTSRTRSTSSREDAGRVRLESQKKAGGRAREGQVRGRDRRRCARVVLRRGRRADRRLHRRRACRAPDTTLEGLAKLQARRSRRTGTVTAGNASPLSDGAAAALVMSEDEGAGARHQAARLLPRLRDRRRRSGDHGHRPGAGGAQAAREDRAHDRRHRPLRAQRGVREPGGLLQRELGIPDDKLNVNGGAIALGHPLGVHRRQAHRDRAPRAEAPRRPLRASSRCASAAAWAPPACSSEPDGASLIERA